MQLGAVFAATTRSHQSHKFLHIKCVNKCLFERFNNVQMTENFKLKL